MISRSPVSPQGQPVPQSQLNVEYSPMRMPTRSVLVTGATGAQGGATARQLLAAGYAVRFLTRSAESPQAGELIRLGAEPTLGDFEDPSALELATRGVNGVFSVQVPDVSGTDSERRHGFALIEAAKKNGVTHFIHTSVSCAGR